MSNFLDLSGEVFGRWNVISLASPKGRYRYWHCVCSCGTERDVKERSLKEGTSKSCGCLQKEIVSKFCKETKRDNLIGKKFGRLEVISRVGYNYELHTTIWECKCTCGNIKNVSTTSLKSGRSLSCGCLRSEVSSERSKIHGDSNSRLYSIWNGMKNRCYDKNIPIYKNYGGRGITVCDDWKNSYATFKEWSIINGYADDLSIDRIDNNGNYEPSNCRWATFSQQCNNRRSNVLITYNGETRTATEWSKIIGIKSSIIARRKKRGWTDKECIETPVLHNNQKLYHRKDD